MKKKRISSTRKGKRRIGGATTRPNSVGSRLTRLETEMEYIKEQVSNHIPTELGQQRKILENINRKLGDIDAVSRFLSVCLKGVGIIGGAIWSIKKIWPGTNG